MPLSRIHLQNMLTLHDAGAKIVPPSPFFYYHPETMDDLVNTVVGKVLDQLNIPHTLFKPWAQND
jgi:4-hydroxy-3-polyprenylbenzoate decarboxylase